MSTSPIDKDVSPICLYNIYIEEASLSVGDVDVFSFGLKMNM